MVIFGEDLARHIVQEQKDKESLKVSFEELFGDLENIHLVKKDENVFKYFKSLKKYYDEYLAGRFDLTDELKEDKYKENPFWEYRNEVFFKMLHLGDKLF